MKLLRKISTRRLLALIVGLVAAVAAGTTIAIAAVGSGPVPPAKPLARAIHDALAAPSVQGISARISFTNHLIDSTDIQGLDPLLTGGSGRLWISPKNGLRLELQSDNGDAQLVVNKGMFWAYDPTSNTVYEGRWPAALMGAHKPAGTKDHSTSGLPSVADIQSFIAHVPGIVSVSGAIPGDIAGRPAYSVRVSPRTSGGLLGAVELGWDAVRGVPLRFAVFARGDSTPVLELTATNISYGPVAASVFAITPPPGAHVVSLPLGALGALGAHSHTAASAHTKAAHRSHAKEVTGVKAVAAHLSFPLAAPAQIAGQPRSSVTLVGHGSALVAYGLGLGGIYVLEQPASPSAAKPSAGSAPDQPGLHLPTVSIGGAPAMEIATPLGTILRFSRGGVSYTVLGSVTRATAEQAARSL
jgi:outer membrane lipoprotein-sorting protein